MTARSVSACAVAISIATVQPGAADPSHLDHAHSESMEHQEHATDPYAMVLGAHHDHGDASFAASLGLVVADYDTRLFTGDYQGMAAGLAWMRDGFGLAARLPVYRISENGRDVTGLGDVMLHGHASPWHRGSWRAGAMVMGMLPTGDTDAGLGMGHVMVMGEGWGSWTRDRLALSCALGYGYALGGVTAHEQHGQSMWPLVDPMNASELTYDVGTMVAVARTLALGARMFGALPLIDGDTRAATGLRAAWIVGPATTSFEIQKGLAGDPFGLRGIVETSVRFR